MGASAAFFAFMAITTGASIYQQQRAAQAQERAERARQFMAREQNRQQLLQADRRARAARAAIAAGAAAQGTLGSASDIGGISSIGSQLANNISFLNSQVRLANFQSRLLAQAAQRQTNANNLMALAQLGASFYANPGKKPPSTGGTSGG